MLGRKVGDHVGIIVGLVLGAAVVETELGDMDGLALGEQLPYVAPPVLSSQSVFNGLAGRGQHRCWLKLIAC